MKRVCIVDDESSICKSLSQILKDEGFETETYLSLNDFASRIERGGPTIDLVLLDIWFKEGDGIAFLKRHQQITKWFPVIIMSGHGTIETAVRATKLGAYDFIEKPISYEKLVVAIDRALKHYEVLSERESLKTGVARELELIGESIAFLKTLDLAIKAASSQANVFIEGENGTGKELFSKLIYRLSQRHKESFISFNCAAVPETLIESELFGYEKGAFTGAVRRHVGKFEMANRGILFLDEIGDMPLSMQAKLLRVLQENKIVRIGGKEEISLDFRVISATNKNIYQLMDKGLFRRDLFYRVNVIPIKIPPLREREKDVPILVNYFCKTLSRKVGSNPKTFTHETLNFLSAYPWPGNVRQLRNFIERVLVFSESEQVDVGLAEQLLMGTDNLGKVVSGYDSALSPKKGEKSDLFKDAENYRKAKELFEKHYFEQKMKKHKGNISQVSSEVGLERSHLYKKLKRLGVHYDGS